MRWLILLLLLAPTTSKANDWTLGDTVREVGFAALVVIDLGQTTTFVRACDYPVMYEQVAAGGCRGELNPLLGPHPSQKRLNAVSAFDVLAHTAISIALPPTWRHIWQYVSLGVEGANDMRTYYTGTVKLSFQW